MRCWLSASQMWFVPSKVLYPVSTDTSAERAMSATLVLSKPDRANSSSAAAMICCRYISRRAWRILKPVVIGQWPFDSRSRQFLIHPLWCAPPTDESRGAPRLTTFHRAWQPPLFRRNHCVVHDGNANLQNNNSGKRKLG